VSFTRRDLLRLAWHAERPAPPPPRPSYLRPPGALPEPEFRAACTRCDACLIACPRESIRRAGPELGPEHEGTPVVLPAEQPCWLCADLPCIRACEPGALLPLGAPREARLGRVRIREQVCFSAQGNPCDVCAERCPVRPKAVRVSTGSAPELDTELCTGCAVCAWLCPAGAIEVHAL
jgi:MauM/NapG family ferredoxin protein